MEENKKIDYVTYDFVEDCFKNSTAKKKYLKKDVFEKYVYYKKNLKLDPDNHSNKLQELYEKLYDKEKLGKCKSDDAKVMYYSDTMTSVQGLLGNYYTKSCIDEWSKYQKDNSQKFFSKKVMEIMFNNLGKYSEFYRKIVNNKSLIEFIKVYHTLGNYIPVPKGFNEGRSGNYACHDMWDLTLMKIKEYYACEEKITQNEALKTIDTLLHSDFAECVNWLNAYDDWKNFIDKNYLNMYVDGNYNIIPFYEGHSWDNPYPNTENEYKIMFDEITKRITERSKELKKILEGEK